MEGGMEGGVEGGRVWRRGWRVVVCGGGGGGGRWKAEQPGGRPNNRVEGRTTGTDNKTLRRIISSKNFLDKEVDIHRGTFC